MLWLTLVATISGAAPLPPIVADFQSVCGAQNQSRDGILAEAKREGWTARPSAPADDGQTQRLIHAGADRLGLAVTTTHSAGEVRQACGLTSATAVPGIAAAAQSALGFKPAVDLGSAATFFAVRTGNRWRSATELTSAERAAAKTAGRLYTIVASSTGTSASIYTLHVTASTRP
ncbi:hypothetical protein [Sphingomonas sp.]|uniref:hypothetical protein n=1 Tax=Sphingomonas sp. TaxID=28214 RepID=UPI003B3ABCBE